MWAKWDKTIARRPPELLIVCMIPNPRDGVPCQPGLQTEKAEDGPVRACGSDGQKIRA
jgi:hypothetical protein